MSRAARLAFANYLRFKPEGETRYDWRRSRASSGQDELPLLDGGYYRLRQQGIAIQQRYFIYLACRIDQDVDIHCASHSKLSCDRRIFRLNFELYGFHCIRGWDAMYSGSVLSHDGGDRHSEHP